VRPSLEAGKAGPRVVFLPFSTDEWDQGRACTCSTDDHDASGMRRSRKSQHRCASSDSLVRGGSGHALFF
jgi:hypothetical protein